MVLEWLRGDRWSRAIRVLAPLCALLVEGVPALLGCVLVQEGGLWLARRISPTCHWRFASGLFLAGFGVRLAIALPTHYVAKASNGNGALFLDDYTTDLVGEWLVRIARGDGIAIFPGHLYLLDGAYSYLLMAVYAGFGYAPLLPKLLNIGLAALSAVLIFDMARRAFGPAAAVLAAIGAAALPTMIVWSVATLKETLVLFFALGGLWIVQWLTTAPRQHPRFVDALVLLAATLTLLLDLRSTTAFILVGVLVATGLMRSHLRPRRWQLGLAGAALVIVAGSGLWFVRARTSSRPITGLVEDVALQIRHRRAQEAAGARSQLRREGDVLDPRGSELPAAEAASDAAPFSISGDVLNPLGYALLAPAPWQAHSAPELAAAAEMPVWYVLLASSMVVWRAAPRQKLFVVCLAMYGVANWLVLAASEGNLGNLLRHRLMLDPVLLILGSAGLAWLWERAGRPLAPRARLLVVAAGRDP